jgi:hypothetical protein
LQRDPDEELAQSMPINEYEEIHPDGPITGVVAPGEEVEILKELLSKIETFHSEKWDGLPDPVSFKLISKNPPEAPPVLLWGMLYVGGKLLITGGSKTRKTWLLFHLAVAVASGERWLGMKTLRAPVLILDLELMPHECADRLMKICRKLEIEYPENLYVSQWRGHRIFPEKIEEKLIEFLKEKGIKLLIVDPFYKWSGGVDEIAIGEIYDHFSRLERIARKAQCAVVFTHHHAKGDASGRAAIDLASGSGIFARDPDALLSIRESIDSNEEEPRMRVEATVRSFPPHVPFGIRFEYPLWRRDDSVDLELKTSTTAKKKATFSKEATVEDLLFILGARELSVSDWKEEGMKRLGINGTQFCDLKLRAKNLKLISERPDGRKIMCRRAVDSEPFGQITDNLENDENYDDLGF